jgi:hypothetical protein
MIPSFLGGREALGPGRAGRRPDSPIEIKAVSLQEIQATRQVEELGQLRAAVTRLEEALKQHEEHAKQEANKNEEEANGQIAAAVKKQQEAEAASKKAQKEVNSLRASLTRAQLLAHALRLCEKQPKSQRARCVSSADRRYGVKAAQTDRPRPQVAG